MLVEGAEGFGIAGRGATLVLQASWFNRSSCNRAKEMAAISMYGCRAFTSPRVSGFKPSIKVPKRAALQPWLSPARATAGKSGRQQGQRRPRATALATGAAAHADGVQRRRLRRATAATMAQ
ncbi:hypothetical protein BHE74_00043215 [Ensete ventricosum]|nr:hypothetical protein BHE74_00043215 [Ensete ventricosum]